MKKFKQKNLRKEVFMKNMVKDEKGVTIVALVITVIVLLILTGRLRNILYK